MELVWYAILFGLVIWFALWVKRQSGGGRGWWGYGRGRPPRPIAPDKPKGGGGIDPELLQVPPEWIEAHAKWAKKTIKDNYSRIKVHASK